MRRKILPWMFIVHLAAVPAAFASEALVLELDPAASQLDDDKLAELGALLARFEKTWATQPVDSLWPLMDAGRGSRLWTVMRRDSLRYGDCFRSALADSGRYRDFQERVWRSLRPRLHGLMDFAPRRASLQRSGDGASRTVFLDTPMLLGGSENLERHADHPFLGEILILSLLSPLDWKDPLFDSWRQAEARVEAIRWQDFKPGHREGMALLPDVRDEKGVEAQIDSLFKADERLKSIGWLKRRFVKKAMKMAMMESLALESAFEEFERQVRGEFGDAPRCPLPGRAVMRFVFLRENSFSRTWRLALCLPSSVQAASHVPLSGEPGFHRWYAEFKKWRKESS